MNDFQEDGKTNKYPFSDKNNWVHFGMADSPHSLADLGDWRT